MKGPVVSEAVGAEMVIRAPEQVVPQKRPLISEVGNQDNQYFDWPDRKVATARQLADTFIERFGHIANAGRGEDWFYAGWYVQMLGLAEIGYFPFAYGDYLESDYFELVALGAPEPPPHLPKPPPGECD
jgi:hypothetical protein